MLWFVDSEVAESALAGKFIEEQEVEARAGRISCENVCLGSIQKYFTHDGWGALLHVVEPVKKNLYGTVDGAPIQYRVFCVVPLQG